eukprot:TRINITY_DN64982_c0_g1_i1.p1 TRINITY_DN64982_c0_g1~~TRINITY_DN64982_c0_g1_i1.p1  ORF type:complete len:532 (+),score=139.99 TRINITY_DN64982_c0_g1_i1:69-1664(+)
MALAQRGPRGERRDPSSVRLARVRRLAPLPSASRRRLCHAPPILPAAPQPSPHGSRLGGAAEWDWRPPPQESPAATPVHVPLLLGEDAVSAAEESPPPQAPLQLPPLRAPRAGAADPLAAPDALSCTASVTSDPGAKTPQKESSGAVIAAALRRAGWPRSSAAAVARAFNQWDLHDDGVLQPHEAKGFLKDLFEVMGLPAPFDWGLEAEIESLVQPAVGGLSVQGCINTFLSLSAPVKKTDEDCWWKTQGHIAKRWAYVGRLLIQKHGSLRSAFANMHSNRIRGERGLDAGELRRELQALGISAEQCSELLLVLDRDISGQIELNELELVLEQSHRFSARRKGASPRRSPRRRPRPQPAVRRVRGAGLYTPSTEGGPLPCGEAALCELGMTDLWGGATAPTAAEWLRRRAKATCATHSAAPPRVVSAALASLRRHGGAGELRTLAELAEACVRPGALEGAGLEPPTAARLRAAVNACLPVAHAAELRADWDGGKASGSGVLLGVVELLSAALLLEGGDAPLSSTLPSITRH